MQLKMPAEAVRAVHGRHRLHVPSAECGGHRRAEMRCGWRCGACDVIEDALVINEDMMSSTPRFSTKCAIKSFNARGCSGIGGAGKLIESEWENFGVYISLLVVHSLRYGLEEIS